MSNLPEQRITALENHWLRCSLAGSALMLGCAGALFYQQVQLADEIAARPPIAVLDVNQHLLQVLAAHPGMETQDATATVWDIGTRLAEQGYVVLRKDSLVAIPDAYEVPQ